MHLGGEWLKSLTGAQADHIPHRGNARTVPALPGGGAIDFLIDPPITAMPQADGGQLRDLAVTTVSDDPRLGRHPTMTDAGPSGSEEMIWNALVACAATLPEVMERLESVAPDFRPHSVRQILRMIRRYLTMPCAERLAGRSERAQPESRPPFA